ncbi:MAG: hypothetical protein COA96_14240 [SAR86 cluster bacterium]|uniref:Uncharacterized protein n=1 Tax=SAR86 cluster bacterium TaxID=2030880 RepID=A0A2A5ATA8_9GAMM|nr:MAG: hypothetical protein COA96_14240 [SAR86 cluster bacterium]
MKGCRESIVKISSRLLIELFGVVSIVASLVFVGFQLQQDRVVALGAQFENRLTTAIELNKLRFDNDAWVNQSSVSWEQGRLPNWWNEDIQNYMDSHSFTMEHMYRLSVLQTMSAMFLDNMVYQHELGLVEDSDWNEIRESEKQALRNPIRRAMYLDLLGSRKATTELIQVMIFELHTEN